MDKILTKQQAAELLQVSDRFIADSIYDKKLRAYKVGKRIYVLYSDILEFIKKHPYNPQKDE